MSNNNTSMTKRKKTNDARATLHYDALEVRPNTRGKVLTVSALPEDRILTRDDRIRLTSTVREAERNFALAGFAIRRHLQYVSEFRLSIDGDWGEDFNNAVEAEFARWANDPARCHVARRFSFWKLLSLIERLRLTDGDVGVLRCKNGSIQLIEGDRIRSEATEVSPDVIQGVHVDSVGGPVSYEIWKRATNANAWEFERLVPAENFDLVGYFDRHDQIRGVSPFAPAIKTLYQMSDGIDYALAKMKFEQLIGLITKRMPEANPLSITRKAESTTTTVDAFGRTNLEAQAQRWISEFGDQMKHFDLNLDESAEFIKGDTPSQNFQSFTEFCIRLILAALDLPYSFLDGSKTNFYGSKGELNGYVNGCRKRQEETIVFLNRLTKWLLERWTLEGRIKVPRGKFVEDIPFKWFGAGTPYWRLIDDSKGFQVAVMNGFTNPEQVCNEHGGSFYDNIDRMEACIQYARKHGVMLAFDPEVVGKVNVGM